MNELYIKLKCKVYQHNNKSIQYICFYPKCQASCRMACFSCMREFHYSHEFRLIPIQDFFQHEKYDKEIQCKMPNQLYTLNKFNEKLQSSAQSIEIMSQYQFLKYQHQQCYLENYSKNNQTNDIKLIDVVQKYIIKEIVILNKVNKSNVKSQLHKHTKNNVSAQYQNSDCINKYDNIIGNNQSNNKNNYIIDLSKDFSYQFINQLKQLCIQLIQKKISNSIFNAKYQQLKSEAQDGIQQSILSRSSNLVDQSFLNNPFYNIYSKCQLYQMKQIESSKRQFKIEKTNNIKKLIKQIGVLQNVYRPKGSWFMVSGNPAILDLKEEVIKTNDKFHNSKHQIQYTPSKTVITVYSNQFQYFVGDRIFRSPYNYKYIIRFENLVIEKNPPIDFFKYFIRTGYIDDSPIELSPLIMKSASILKKQEQYIDIDQLWEMKIKNKQPLVFHYTIDFSKKFIKIEDEEKLVCYELQPNDQDQYKFFKYEKQFIRPMLAINGLESAKITVYQ